MRAGPSQSKRPGKASLEPALPLNLPLLEHRLPLAARVSKELRRGIEQGQWRGWLPGERPLSRQLGISRMTCSQALDALVREGWIERVPGIGTKISNHTHQLGFDSTCNASVGIIMPHPVASMRTKITVLVDDLREQLANRGLRLEVCHSPRLYGPHPARILAATIRQQASACWLLLMTTRATQEWFAQMAVPCLTLGTNYEGVNLPSAGADLRAIGRHAAGTLIAAGHRSIAFLFHRLPGSGAGRWSAGDVLFGQGFADECRSRREPVKAQVIDHEETLAGTAQALQRALAGGCTGIVVANSHCYLSVISLLAGRGLRVPRDVSLICRDDDHFLDFLSPRPARYCGILELMLKEVMVNLPCILSGELESLRRARLFPRFDAGGSIRQTGGALPRRPPA